MHLLLRTTLLLRLGDVMRVDACERHSEYSRVVHGLVPPRSLALSFGARSARSPALANCGYCSGAGSFGSPPRSPPGYAPRTQRKHSELLFKKAGCSKAAKWAPFFSSLWPLRRAFGRRLHKGRL